MPPETLAYSSIYNDAEKVEHYWHNLQPNLDTKIISSQKWKAATDFFEQVSFQNSVVVLIWDTTIHRFIYVVDKRNIIGHPVDKFLSADGVEFSISQFHPDYLDANLMMQQKGFEMYLEVAPNERNKIIVNFDGMYKTASGEYTHILQQAVGIEFDEAGNGILFLSYIHDISHLKKNKTSNLIVTNAGDIRLWNYNFERKKLEPVQSLSKQEKRILLFLSKGKTSKEIADELNISSLTVDTHRRNLLKKTNCIDTTAMITYSKIVGLI